MNSEPPYCRFGVDYLVGLWGLIAPLRHVRFGQGPTFYFVRGGTIARGVEVGLPATPVTFVHFVAMEMAYFMT